MLTPSPALRERLARRIGDELGRPPIVPTARRWVEPPWEEVAPGISCKLLTVDAETGAASMLVRLAPGGEYPAHTHAGVEELHLLDGELWIDERKLFPGDYNYGAPGAGDERVWRSEEHTSELQSHSELVCRLLLVTNTYEVLGM